MRLPTRVTYLHHTRDQDGDVVFYFTDRTAEVHQSSPLVKLVCLATEGVQARCVLCTQNNNYEAQIPLEKAEHLAVELGQE